MNLVLLARKPEPLQATAVRGGRPRDAVGAGLVLVPDDRALFHQLSTKQNLLLAFAAKGRSRRSAQVFSGVGGAAGGRGRYQSAAGRTLWRIELTNFPVNGRGSHRGAFCVTGGSDPILRPERGAPVPTVARRARVTRLGSARRAWVDVPLVRRRESAAGAVSKWHGSGVRTDLWSTALPVSGTDPVLRRRFRRVMGAQMTWPPTLRAPQSAVSRSPCITFRARRPSEETRDQ